MEHESRVQSQLQGRVFCREVRSSRSIRSFIEKQIREWVGLHQGEPGAAAPAEYVVTFAREGFGQVINCQVEIRLGSRVWRGIDIAHGLQQALHRCLKHMMPVHAMA